jgi:hypothetical protein
MRSNSWLWCVLIVAAALSSTAARQASDAAPKPESFAGVWSGTWDAGGTGGGFELTLEQSKDGPLTGRVSVTGEPTYKAAFKSLSFDGKKMSAKYDFPADQPAEVTLAATFEGDKATGTWSLAARGSDTAVASGTWTVTRKP